MAATIVEVPAMAGDPGHAAAAGPAVLTAALADAGRRLPVVRVAIPPFTGNVVRASVEVSRRVAEAVRPIVEAGASPLVLAGSCDVAPGVIAGLGEQRSGVVWIDAHADYNTPESSETGFWPGMTLAVVVGDCASEVWASVGGQPIRPNRVALFGVRSLSPEAEARRIADSPVRTVGWHRGAPQTSVTTALDDLDGEVAGVYLHLDLDALDPAIGKGVVDPPVPGGLTAEQLGALIDAVRERCPILGATIATYTPANDDGSTLPVAVTAAQRIIADW